ncbi:MAG: hypothetical protein ACRBF0_16150 [Calditrichia bacterium]
MQRLSEYKIWILLILILSGFSLSAKDKPTLMGVGIIAGEPTGFSLKYWTGKGTAFDAGLGWSFGNQRRLHLHGDWLINKPGGSTKKTIISFYYGLGARMKVREESKIGIRIPTGIDVLLKKSPLDIFMEVVPILDVVPETKISFNLGIGVRYYFRA